MRWFDAPAPRAVPLGVTLRSLRWHIVFAALLLGVAVVLPESRRRSSAMVVVVAGAVAGARALAWRRVLREGERRVLPVRKGVWFRPRSLSLRVSLSAPELPGVDIREDLLGEVAREALTADRPMVLLCQGNRAALVADAG